jgi:NAD-dependent SIR2 family protein deacetylase
MTDSDHRRVVRQRGKAAEHDCVDCGGQAVDWSWTHDTDRGDPENYKPRCKRCHFKYDGLDKNLDRSGARHSQESKDRIAEAKRGNTNWVGRRHTPETRAKLSEAARRREASKRLRVEDMEQAKSVIMPVITSRRRSK